jgi:hypothetical protein
MGESQRNELGKHGTIEQQQHAYRSAWWAAVGLVSTRRE